MTVPVTSFEVTAAEEVGGVHVGTAYVTTRRGVSTITFSYDLDYIRDGGRSLGPDLPLGGRSATVGLPGAFADSAPDRWGRLLLTRAAALGDDGGSRFVSEVDFLLGVADETRQGHLRYAIGDGPFLQPDGQVPKLIELPTLLNAASAVEASSTDDDGAIRTLLDAGSASLGGARPKAAIRDGSVLAIAKFPHRLDQWNVIAWEKVMLDLAELAGIEVPARTLVAVGNAAVLVVERFDRSGERRIPYVSAMTLLGATDGEQHDYEDIAEVIAATGEEVERDLEELFRRAVLSVAINNTDDHLRNHGFLWGGQGWRLAPVFDLNPNPLLGTARQTSIHFDASERGAREALRAFAISLGLDESTVRSVVTAVNDAILSWRTCATSAGIDGRELRQFAPVFSRSVTLP